MEKLTEKLEILNQEIVQRIIDLMETKGLSQDGRMMLPIQDEEQMHNLEGGRWLVGITRDMLIDNGGYTYSHEAISVENLCLAIDSIAEQPSKFRVGTMDANGTMEEFKYFEDENLMYEHFINVRAEIINGEHQSAEVWTEKRVNEPNRHGEYEYETMQSYSVDEDEND